MHPKNMGPCIKAALVPHWSEGYALYIHFTHRNTVARFLLLHKLGGDFAHILLIQRGATEICFDVGHRQDTPIAVVGLVCDIVFRNGGQYVQRNAEGLDAFDISHLLVCKPYRLTVQSAKLHGRRNFMQILFGKSYDE